MKSIERYIRPIIASILSVWFAIRINIFEYITFIPDEYTFELCIAAYLIVVDIAIEQLTLTLDRYLRSSVSVVISLPQTEVSIDSTPNINFNTLELAEMNLSINIYGRRQHFKHAKILVPNLNIATMQVSLKDKDIYVDKQGNLVIEPYGMFGQTYEKSNISSCYRVSMIREPVESERTIEIRPIILKKSFFVSYKRNHANLIIRG